MRRAILAAALFAFPGSASAADDPKAIEFFENKIRPVLVEHCYKCHSAPLVQGNKHVSPKGGLRLDSRAAMLKGGDTGSAVVPGKPGEGSLLKSLKYGDIDAIRMPPKGKLPDAVIKDFEKWIADGAVDPRIDATSTPAAGIDLDRGRQFWSFQPPKAVAPPTPKNAAWVKTPIDAFILAKLDEKGLVPVAPADKRTLLRRVYFDLIGLPPQPDVVDAFLADAAPDALTKLVEKLLSSPAYGEKWARHWLDVARYAEDQAHTFGVKPKTFAWRYRDWVIAAFNSDMPYDQFVKLQIAGDLMPDAPNDPFTKYAGLGFIGLGAEYYKNTAAAQAIAEELDDRVDTLTRGFLGVTVACARCHDHKFDPIPTRDYYSLAGIYIGTNLSDAPLVSPAEAKAYADAQAAIKTLDDKVKASVSDAAKKASKDAQAKVADYLGAAWKYKTSTKSRPSVEEFAKADGLNPYFLARWVKFVDAPATRNHDVLKPWFALKPAADDDEVKKAIEPVAKAIADAAKNAALVKAVMTDPTAPFFVPPADAEKLASDADKVKLAEMRMDLEKKRKESPPAPPVAHVVSGGGAGMKVYVRGNPATKGEDAPKGFLQVLPTSKPAGADFTRLDLANAIASKGNPLTARVIVNRVWAAHFGRGLVNTPSNFGALGDKPSHPELLDYLAVKFMEKGWSLKWLHREILASATYQLSSNAEFGMRSAESKSTVFGIPIPQSEFRNPNSEDAANVYLWRGTRHRLDIELWRDSLLSVSGNLDPKVGGPTFDLRDANAKRRTVYAKVSRHELDGLLRLFDFPDANVTADKRTITTVPQQQLFALNSEFMAIQARAFTARVEKLGTTDTERVRAAYRLAFTREPDARELEIAECYLKLPPRTGDVLTRWQQYAQALLASNELMYVD